MRGMRVDSEFAGLLIVVGFVALGLVSIPFAKWFFVGTAVVGVAVALLFRFARKGYSGPAGILVAAGFALALVFLPLARWFLVGAACVGGAVAMLFRFTRKE